MRQPTNDPRATHPACPDGTAASATAEGAEEMSLETELNVMKSTNGAEVWIPTQEEIAATCREVRSEWSHDEWVKR